MLLLPLLSVRMILELQAGIPTEHFNSRDNRTFSQRSCVNRAHSGDGGFDYALIYIGVEGDLHNASVSGGSVQALAAKPSAPLFFGLEHRFFGESQPFPRPDSSRRPCATSRSSRRSRLSQPSSAWTLVPSVFILPLTTARARRSVSESHPSIG